MISLYTIFIGNPGVGKSTLLNALAGKIMFHSATQPDAVTERLQLEEIAPDEYYCDTPGLDDFDKKRQAAQEIQRALKQDGEYKLVFVVALQNGRIRNEDLWTIQVVLDALTNLTEIPYGIVVNSVNADSPIFDSVELQEKYLQLFNKHSNTNKTEQICFYKVIPDLVGKVDSMHVATPDFKEFVEKLQSIVVKPENVKNLDVERMLQAFDDLEAKNKELQSEIEKLQNEKTENQNGRFWGSFGQFCGGVIHGLLENVRVPRQRELDSRESYMLNHSSHFPSEDDESFSSSWVSNEPMLMRFAVDEAHEPHRIMINEWNQGAVMTRNGWTHKMDFVAFATQQPGTIRLVVGKASNPDRVMINHSSKSQEDWNRGGTMATAGWTHLTEFWAYPSRNTDTIRIVVGEAHQPHRIMINHASKTQDEWNRGGDMNRAGWKHLVEFWAFPGDFDEGGMSN